MVSSSNGREAILIGCRENPEKIYKLRWSNGTNMEWMLMKQKLNYPRSNAVAMLISDKQTHCKQKGNNINLTLTVVDTSTNPKVLGNRKSTSKS